MTSQASLRQSSRLRQCKSCNMSPYLDVNLLIEWQVSQNFNLADKSKNIRLAVESQYIGPCRLTVIRQHYTDSLISKLECLPYFNTGDIDKNSGLMMMAWCTQYHIM